MATNPTIAPQTLDFLAQLKENNQRDWFEQNKASYQQAKQNFEQFIDALIVALSPYEDFAGLKAKDCLFRINRDVRFSKDKSPYKINISAVVTPGGKKSVYMHFYIHIQPGGSFVAGGAWEPDSAQLARIRQEIDYNTDRFKQIITAPDFVAHFGAMGGEKLKNPPKGYERDHPEIELLKYKQFIVSAPLTDAQVTGPDFFSYLVKLFVSMQPFLYFLNFAITDEERFAPSAD